MTYTTNETERPKNQSVIKLRTKEMSLTDCMDLSQVTDMPINRLHFALEEIIGIHQLNSVQVNYLYKPYWLYYFEPNELELLLRD